MARKYDGRGSFKGVRVQLDGVSGEVNLRLPYNEMRQILTAAALNGYDSLEKIRKASDAAQVGQKAESIAYHEGMIRFIKGLELLMEAHGSSAPRTLAQDPLTRQRSVKERRQYVQRAQKERRMFDDLFAAVRASRSEKA